jgi:hypothetical protein
VSKRVFLSYPRTIRPRVEALALHLQRCGFDAYFDEQLSGGQPWWDELLDHIEACDVFMPVLAIDYIESVPCRSEAAFAEALGKPFVPVAVEPDLPLRMFPPRIVNTHCVAFNGADAATWFDVVRALNSAPPAPPPPIPAPPRPSTPVTYLTELTDRVHFPGELTRQQQLLLLEDLKARYHGDADVRALTRKFATRPDLYQQVATQLGALLTQVPAGAGAGNGAHPWAGSPPSPPGAPPDGPRGRRAGTGWRPPPDPSPGTPPPGAPSPGWADGAAFPPGAPAGERVANHLLPALASILACGLISPGWASLYFALQVDRRLAAGDADGAREASRYALVIAASTLVFAGFVALAALLGSLS